MSEIEGLPETWRRLSEGRASVTDKALTTLFTLLPCEKKNLKVLDVTSEPLNGVQVLPKLDANAQWFIVVNGELYPWDISTAKQTLKNEKLNAPTNATLFKFDGHDFLMIDLPSSGMDKTFLYHDSPEAATKVIREARKIYRRMNRSEPSIQVYNGGNVKFTTIRELPYVPPSLVMRVWNQRIKPQMEEKKIYDHVVFSGPPGTGKTAFCRWMATQVPKWKFMFVPPEVLNGEGYIGRVFNDAKNLAPSVLVFEDIDLVGRTRFDMSEGFTPKLGELLNRLDGVEPRHTTLVLASTNNIAALDPALMRHGRFGIKLELRYTDQEKIDIVRSYYKIPVDNDVLLDAIRAIDNPVKLKMVAKMAEIYHEHDKQELTPGILRRIAFEIQTDKQATFIGGDVSNDEDAEAKEYTPKMRFTGTA